MIRSLTNIASNRSGAIAGQMTGFFTVESLSYDKRWQSVRLSDKGSMF